MQVTHESTDYLKQSTLILSSLLKLHKISTEYSACELVKPSVFLFDKIYLSKRCGYNNAKSTKVSNISGI